MAYVKEVSRNNQNRHLFRQVARESSGEIFEPEDGCRLFFLYKKNPAGYDPLLAVGSCMPADPQNNNAEAMLFTGRYYHNITYMFVMPRYQNEGYGTMLLRYMEREILKKLKRPFRVQSSYKAVRFFQSHGYVQQGEPIECVYSGSPLFRTLHNMQKDALS